MKERHHHKQEIGESGSLSDLLIGNDLHSGEQRAVMAIDILSIPLSDKKTLIGGYMHITDGIFRTRDVLGFSPDQSVLARDRVRTVPKFEALWEKLGFLMQPSFLEVALGKNQGLKHQEIASSLEIDKPQIDEISKFLIAKKIIRESPRGKHNSIAFAEFISIVEKMDNPNVSDKEIAEKLGETEGRVKRARRRLRLQGRIGERTPTNVANSQRKARSLLELREKVRSLTLQGKNIAVIVEETGASHQQIKHQRRILLRNKQIPLIRY